MVLVDNFGGSGHLLALVNKVPSDIERFFIDMGCNHPNKAFWTGTYTANGKKDLIFMPGTFGDRLNVKAVKDHRIAPGAELLREDGQTFLINPIPIPCGTCLGCRLQRSKDWTIRLVHEAENYVSRCWFVTLTYDDEHLPFVDGEASLVKSAPRDFIKWLRVHTGRRFRYFACGEYGEDTARPHYHLIIFGDLALGDRLALNAWHSPEVEHCWPYGLHSVSVADVTTMAYTAGYVIKKQKDYEKSRPVKPFIACSDKPPLGSHYIKNLKGRDDYLVYGNFGNFKFSESIPRAYLKKCEEEDWYPAIVAWKMERALNKVYDYSVITGTNIEDLQGFCKDDAIRVKFLNRRNEKI